MMTTRRIHSRRRSAGARTDARSGSALIAVLWVIALLSMFVGAFAFDMHIESRITSAWRKKMKADCLARAGIELARMALVETADPDVVNPEISGYTSMGSDKELRAATVSLAQGAGAELERQLGDGTIILRVIPENARINLNRLVDVNNRETTAENLKPLFEQAGIPWENCDVLVDCLLDWVDQDDLTHLGGVESEYYERLDPPYKAKNGIFDTVDELMLVKGFNEFIPGTSQTVYEAMAPFLTTYADDDKININAADAQTIAACLGIDLALAEQIVAERNGPDGRPGTEDDKPFKDINDARARVPGLNQPGIETRIDTKQQGRFTLIARGRVGDIERVMACVVKLEKKDLTILSWMEGDSSVIELLRR